MPALRKQPPTHSPLSPAALARGAGALLPGMPDPRPGLLGMLAREVGATSGILTDSGTSALRLALELLHEEGRAPIALPAYACYDVATAAVGANVPVVLYDVDPVTLSPDFGSLDDAVSAGAGALVVAPLFGIPVDWDEIRSRTTRHGVTVVEDAAQSHGARWRGDPLGRHGDLVVLSFGRGKGWTGGSGGALLGRSDAWDERMERLAYRIAPQHRGKEMANLGRALSQWLLARPYLYGIPSALPWLGLGETRWKDPRAPAALGISAAAVALATREAADRETRVRRENGRHLRELFESRQAVGRRGAPFQFISPPLGGEAGYLRFPVLASSRASRPTFGPPPEARKLGAVPGYPTTLEDLDPLRPLLAPNGSGVPGATQLAQSLTTLPTHSLMSTRDRERLVQLLVAGAPRE